MELLQQSINEHRSIKIPSTSLQSYEKFIERLQTFHPSKWFSKPHVYTPLECAKYGWFCFDKDTLKCSLCLSKFYVCMEKYGKRTQDQTLKPTNLQIGHSLKCPWRTLNVSNELIYIDVSDKFKLYQKYKDCLETFKNCQSIPIIEESLILKYNLNNISLISACGWSFISKINALKCDKCLRSVGLWLYNTSNNNTEKSEIESCLESILCQIENNNKKYFNPVNSHFAYCPWLVTHDDNNFKVFEMNISIIKEFNSSIDSNNLYKMNKKQVDFSYDKMRSIQLLLTNCASLYNTLDK